MKIIAICSNIPVFWDNKILDEKHCLKYPGASWMPIFAKIAKDNGYNVVSGDIALKNRLKFHNIFVIQELNAKHGLKLLKKGAIAAVLTAGESPIFSYYFYDNIAKIAKKFKVRKLFKDSLNFIDANGKNTPMYFPSYFATKKRDIIPWNKREFTVMVAANKSINAPLPQGLKNQIIWLIHKVYKLYSPSFKKYSKKELHSKRLEILKYFGNKSKIDLYGANWLDFKRFEFSELKKLKSILENLSPSFCEDKIKTISKYKFTFCLENISMKGYVTEKIIDCLVAGTIPVYLGAPDIFDFIPKECFIDMRNFKSMEELECFLQNLDEDKAYKMIESGQRFLDSKDGQKFSYEYFAKNMMSLIKEIDDNN